MSLQIHRPCVALQGLVQMMWEWQGYAPTHTHERILPQGTTEITIDLANQTLGICYPMQDANQHIVHGLTLAGPRAQPFIIDTAKSAHILNVWFKAGAVQRFFNISSVEIYNQHLPLALICSHTFIDNLVNQLQTAINAQARFAIMEAFLCARLTHASTHPAIAYALTLFNRTPHTQTITQVVRQIALSAPRFIALFHQQIGLTPKRYCRLQRFHHAARLAAQTSTPNWADIALICGYYDQAHLINEFHSFAGIRPTQFHPQSPTHYTNLPIS
jgi:AraC-like DNA-binding protein